MQYNYRPARRDTRILAMKSSKSNFSILAFLLILPLLLISTQLAFSTQIQRVISPGGIEAWLVEEHSIPILTMNFAFRGGSSQEHKDKAGLANVLSAMLDEGAGDIKSQDFLERLEDLSVHFDFSTGKDFFHGEFKTLSANQNEAFDLLALALNQPRFDTEPLERMKSQIVSGLKRNARDPDRIASRLWFENAFSKHPYSQPTKGTESTVSNITARDLRNYRENVFALENLKIAVVGAIDAETLGVALDQIFGKLPGKANLKTIPAADLKISEARHTEFDSPQTVIRFGGRSIDRADNDFVAAYVVNHILGGGSFSSRLYDEVREKRGLAYSIFTHLMTLDSSALYIGGVSTRNETAAEVLSLVKQELTRIANEGPTQQELDETIKYLTGSYALRFDTSDKIAGQLVAIQIEELGIDYINTRNKLVSSVTLEDAKRAAKRVFGDGGLFVATVGPIMN